MKIINFEQRSNEWLEWRKSGIGASESAAVLGMSKYKTPFNIWEQKTDRAFPEPINADMQRGIDLEDEARLKFQEKHGGIFTPICAEREDYPFVMASFDGVSMETGEFLEIKCPRSSKMSEALIAGHENIRELFPHYWIQVQQQYAVWDEAKMGYLAAYLNGEITHLPIPRDNDFIEQKLIPELIVFWNSFVKKDKEPPLSDADYLFINDVDAVVDAQEWVIITSEIKALQEREKAIRASLIDRGDDGSIKFGNILRATRINKKGTVDMKKLYEAYAITENDLKKFRKPGIGFYQLKAL